MAPADVVLIVLIVSLVSAILYAKDRNNKLNKCVADINSLAAEKQAAEEKIKSYEDRLSEEKQAAEEKIKSYEDRLSEEKQATEKKIKSYEDRLSRLSEEKQAAEEKIKSYEGRLSRLSEEKQAAEEKIKSYEDRFSDVFDKEAEIEKLSSDKQSIEDQITSLRRDYKDKRATYDNLVRQAAIYDEEIELAELGFYKPHYDFDDSKWYKEEIDAVRRKQRDFIKGKVAIYCTTEWKVNESRTKGRTWENRAIRLTARAFNNECDAAMSKVRWNNAVRMEERIRKGIQCHK